MAGTGNLPGTVPLQGLMGPRGRSSDADGGGGGWNNMNEQQMVRFVCYYKVIASMCRSMHGLTIS